MNRLREMMFGRNGFDQLSVTVLASGLVFLLIAGISGLTALAFLYLGCIVYAVFRVMSTNVHARRSENIKFLSAVNTVITPLKLRVRMIRERKTHRYIRCERCRSWLRVPRNKGTISVRCARCGHEFIRKV